MLQIKSLLIEVNLTFLFPQKMTEIYSYFVALFIHK